MEDISQTLKERGSRYGSFSDQGRIEQNIKRAFADSPNWRSLPDDSKSALEMIATKISRILKGDADYHDSWHDIIGYAKLVADRIAQGIEAAPAGETRSGSTGTAKAWSRNAGCAQKPPENKD